jgi:hypothetical protein
MALSLASRWQIFSRLSLKRLLANVKAGVKLFLAGRLKDSVLF